MQFSLVCDVLLQQCLTEVIGTIPVLIWDSVKDHRLCSDSSCYTGVEVAGPFESRQYRVRVVRLRRRYKSSSYTFLGDSSQRSPALRWATTPVLCVHVVATGEALDMKPR